MEKKIVKPAIPYDEAKEIIDKAANITEKVFGIHRNEFMCNNFRRNPIVVKARYWFFWCCIDIFELPTANLKTLNIVAYSNIIQSVNVVRNSKSQADLKLVNKYWNIKEQIECRRLPLF